MTTGKLMGIDYGTKRIGTAISDENRALAFPKETVLNDLDIFKKIGGIIDKEGVEEIVIGESVDFSGKLNALSGRTEIFILELKDRFNLPVHKQKEFLTSVEARRYENHNGQARKIGSGKKDFNPSQAHSRVKKIKSGRMDARAAALILQRYLDKINKQSQVTKLKKI